MSYNMLQISLIQELSITVQYSILKAIAVIIADHRVAVMQLS